MAYNNKIQVICCEFIFFSAWLFLVREENNIYFDVFLFFLEGKCSSLKQTKINVQIMNDTKEGRRKSALSG